MNAIRILEGFFCESFFGCYLLILRLLRFMQAFLVESFRLLYENSFEVVV